MACPTGPVPLGSSILVPRTTTPTRSPYAHPLLAVLPRSKSKRSCFHHYDSDLRRTRHRLERVLSVRVKASYSSFGAGAGADIRPRSDTPLSSIPLWPLHEARVSVDKCNLLLTNCLQLPPSEVQYLMNTFHFGSANLGYPESGIENPKSDGSHQSRLNALAAIRTRRAPSKATFLSCPLSPLSVWSRCAALM